MLKLMLQAKVFHFSFYSSDLPEGSVIEEPSRLDVLSEAIMNRSALNDLDSDCLSQTSGEYKARLCLLKIEQNIRV